jgi:hypothetical protein
VASTDLEWRRFLLPEEGADLGRPPGRGEVSPCSSSTQQCYGMGVDWRKWIEEADLIDVMLS